MRIAVPVWHNRVSPVLDSAQRVLFLDVASGAVTSRIEVPVTAADPVGKARELAAKGTELVICGGISRTLAMVLHSEGIRVVANVSGEVDSAIRGVLAGGAERPCPWPPGPRRRRRRRGWGPPERDESAATE